MGLLASLRQKSSRVKSRYALFGALGFTLVIASVWTTTIPARFSSIQTSVDEVGENTASAKNSIDGLMERFDEAKKTTNETAAVNEPSNSDSALGTLSNWNAVSSTTEATPSNAIVPTTTRGAATGTTQSEGDSAVKPAVILIGTTTTKIAE